MTEIRHAGPAPADPPAQPTPAQAIVAAAAEVHRTTDKRGRSIGIRRLGVLERSRFLEMIGGENAQNSALMMLFVPAQLVVEIAGTAVRRPMTRRELDARLQELDEDGLDAVTALMAQVFGEAAEALDDAAAAAAQKQQLKNGAGTPG